MSVHITELKDVELTHDQRQFLIHLLTDFVMGVNKLDEPSPEFAWALMKKLI